MTQIERYEKAVEVAKAELIALSTLGGGSSTGNVMAKIALDKINAILHPEPEYEEVELVRWMCTRCDEVYDFKPVTTNCGATLNAHGGECEGTEYIKLTGTLRRPKPQKVERSVSVANCVILSSGEIVIDNGPCPHNIYPFKDHRGLYGQRGTLTFTWTEEGEGK